jgi:predicted nucleotidyltransferase
MSILRRDEVLDVLSRHKAEFAERYSVVSLGVFGSVARNEAGNGSDVDVVVEMTKPDLFSMVHIKEFLEAELHRPVDIVRYQEHMGDFLKQRIDREAVYV